MVQTAKKIRLQNKTKQQKKKKKKKKKRTQSFCLKQQSHSSV